MRNKVILIGRLTANPEIKQTEKSCYCNFTIACDGESQNEKTEFIDVIVWGKYAENLCKFKKKGELILVEAKLKNNSWEKDEVKRKTLQVVAQFIDFLPTSGKSTHSNDNNDVVEEVGNMNFREEEIFNDFSDSGFVDPFGNM